MFQYLTQKQCRRLAITFAHSLQAEHLKQLYIHLHGEIGAGKTTWIQWVVAALGSDDQVRSPTYAFAHNYQLNENSPLYGSSLWHFDLYRLSLGATWDDLGIFELRDCIVFIEWADRVEPETLPSDLIVSIEVVDSERRNIALMEKSAIGALIIKRIQACWPSSTD